jgi:2-polyprenyl-3-methyl-5-hydroxy-6-metoxy-1,4-benzoquinol methylase
MARALPATSITGVELETDFLDIARARAEFYNLQTLQFALSPPGDRLPDEIGTFDFIVLPAVYEHLLPHERKRLMPQPWGIPKKDGVLFIDEIPNRWFPLETHTSNLPLVNYLPDALAQSVVRSCSRR